MSKFKIEKIQDKSDSIIFDTLKDASNSINSKMDNWKIQMLIVNAINTKKKAFGANWKKVI